MRFVSAAIFCLFSLPVAAECVGTNLIAEMPAETQARIDEAVAAVPFHRGNLWRATKDDAEIVLVGTYHFADSRHDAMMQRLAGALDDAALLYVEAGPEQEAQLTEALQNDPELMFDSNGPTLPERLTEDEWQRLSTAIEARGVPAIIASRMRPWYIALLVGISPCMMQRMTENGDPGGLDRMLTARAEELDIPVRALEPWDTVFSIFEDLTPDQEEDMIRANLPAAEYADDYAATLTEAYFDADVWRIWEFARFDAYATSGLPHEIVDEQMDLARAMLMDRRNQSWIEPLTTGAFEAAEDGKGIVAGFGALHLPGQQGVLQLLKDDGWELERLDG